VSVQRRPPYRFAALTVIALLAGCSVEPARWADATPAATAAPTVAAPQPSAPAPAPSTPDAFTATTERVTAADLPHSWRSGCPVGPADLRRIRLTFWGFDGVAHTGAIVVHRAVVPDVTSVFRTLYAARFPIRSLRPVDEYGGSDDRSMAADNTSGFNCRNAVAAGRPTWSVHAYGRAIDVNPVENPYLLGAKVLPPNAVRYVDRARRRPGMAYAGGTLVQAFAAVGWKWNGTPRRSPDYQHFSETGG
jgi:hypothetical protein